MSKVDFNFKMLSASIPSHYFSGINAHLQVSVYVRKVMRVQAVQALMKVQAVMRVQAVLPGGQAEISVQALVWQLRPPE